MATIRIVLDVDVEPWTAQQLANDCGMDADGFDDCTDGDINPFDIAESIAIHLSYDEVSQEVLAGSGFYVNITKVGVNDATLFDSKVTA